MKSSVHVTTQRQSGWCWLLMDSSGWHEFDITLPGVEIVNLPPKCTAKHQQLDLCIVVTSEIRYPSSLLSVTLDVVQARRLYNHGLQSATRHGSGDSRVKSCPMSAMRWSCLTNHGHPFLKLQRSIAVPKVNSSIQCTSCTWTLYWNLLPRIQQ